MNPILIGLGEHVAISLIRSLIAVWQPHGFMALVAHALETEFNITPVAVTDTHEAVSSAVTAAAVTLASPASQQTVDTLAQAEAAMQSTGG